MTKKEVYRKSTKKAFTTKNLILSEANDIINSKGVVDFRIDTLSVNLKLSPGNITYHFPKKEEILNSLWRECYTEIIESTEIYISQLMDIKQLYLYYKSTITILYKYRGVVCFKLGDISMVKDNEENKESELFFHEWQQNFDKILSILGKSEYITLVKDKYLYNATKQSSFINIFWSIHTAATFNSLNSSCADRFAVVAIFQLYSIMTQTGLDQLKEIYNITSKIKE